MVTTATLPAMPRPAIGLWDRLLARRDRLLASPGFRRWAVAFPLTRPLARRRTRALFDLCAGFVYSQVLLACVQLRLFETLLERPRTLGEIVRLTALPPLAAERLVLAAVSLRLLARRSGSRFGVGELGAVVAGNAAIIEMVMHHTMLYADLRDPLALLRAERGGTELARYWPYAGADRPEALAGVRVADYTALMAASQPLVAGEILAAYSLRQHRCLLDIGGGDGSFLVAAARQAPRLQLKLFDLPPVAERARVRFDAAGLSARAETFGGDFAADPLPPGADIASLVRVIHDHDDDRARAILRAARAALPSGGVLLLAEPMAGTPGAEPIGDAYFGFYLFAMGRGRARTPAELTAMLHATGFAQVRAVPTHTPLLTGLLVATAA